MVAVPGEMPVTAPVVDTVARVLLQLQLPPADVLLRVMVAFTHTLDGPKMALGEELTVMVTPLPQPVGSE